MESHLCCMPGAKGVGKGKGEGEGEARMGMGMRWQQHAQLCVLLHLFCTLGVEGQGDGR